MQSTQSTSVLIILIAIVFTCDSQQTYRQRFCRQGSCGDECGLCKWGSRWNEICSYRECAKGPTELCIEHRGECGDGLQCRCGTCHGCSSVSVEEPCHSTQCLPLFSATSY